VHCERNNKRENCAELRSLAASKPNAVVVAVIDDGLAFEDEGKAPLPMVINLRTRDQSINRRSSGSAKRRSSRASNRYLARCYSHLDMIGATASSRTLLFAQAIQIVLEDDPIIYLCHRRWLVTHAARLAGYRQFPDGVIRVVGLSLN
jgi:hypothetical protein